MKLPQIPNPQLHFNPMRPHILYAAFRRHRAIYSWDLRADVGAPLAVYSPPTKPGEETNQKRRFDVDIVGRFLGVGDQVSMALHFSLLRYYRAGADESQDGNVNIFDLSEPSEGESSVATEPRLTWTAHEGEHYLSRCADSMHPADA
jgi:hypothetical protein